MKRILLIEDDEGIRTTIRDFFRHAGYEVIEEERGDMGLKSFQNYLPDIVLLDLNLPGMDGILVCKKIREVSQVPVIIITARREEADQLKGFDIGADDYITKPFSVAVLVKKVEKMLLWPQRELQKIVHYKTFELLAESQEFFVIKGDKKIPIHFTPNEFAVIYALTSYPNKVFTRDDLGENISEDFYLETYDRTIDTHIKNIRKKLGTYDYIQTVWGKGYKAEEE